MHLDPPRAAGHPVRKRRVQRDGLRIIAPVMPADSASLYAALLARDRRFDGRFLVGVTSTGIYCRPVCQVRTPRAANCRFFPHAAAAIVRLHFNQEIFRRLGLAKSGSLR